MCSNDANFYYGDRGSEVDRIDLYSGTPGFETYVGSVDMRTAEDIISAAPVEDIFKSPGGIRFSI